MIITIICFKPDKAPFVLPEFYYPVISEAGRIAGAASENLKFISVVPVETIVRTDPHESLGVKKNAETCIL